MKQLVLAVVAVALVAAPAAAEPNVPGSRPGVTPNSACVSGWEAENLAWGTPRVEAEKFLDGPGRGEDQKLRVYRSCAGPWDHAQVHVRYINGRVAMVMNLRIGRHGTLGVPPRS